MLAPAVLCRTLLAAMLFAAFAAAQAQERPARPRAS